MEIREIPLSEITPYYNNAKRHDKKQIDNVAVSIKQYGFVQPLVIDRNGEIIIGHCRYEAAKKLHLKTVPCVAAETLTEDEVKALRLADNKLNESEWDIDLLTDELDGLDFGDLDLDWGIEQTKEEALQDKYSDAVSGSLSKEFVMPPFSVLDGRSGDWQARKKIWKSIVDSGKGRDEELLRGSLKDLAVAMDVNLTGTSIFDPVLCECMINWFCPVGGTILDPFAGGSVRGMVSAALGREYYGNDLSEKQIAANRENAAIMQGGKDVFGNPVKMPIWSIGDSANIDELIERRDFDFLLTCPPYADLEVYSDDPHDISNMSYEDFLAAYQTIFNKAVRMLKPNAFIVVVVGEVRDKSGYYRNFIGDTVETLEKAGAHYYNECVFITPYSTAVLRARRQFNAGQKLVNVHQKALVFLREDGTMQGFDELLDNFHQTRALGDVKQSALVFLKGNAKQVEIAPGGYELVDE